MRRQAVRVLTAGALLSAALLSPVEAQDDKPPRTHLKSRDVSQRGLQGSYCWGAAEGGLCVDYIPRWPRADRGYSRARARIRIFLATQPDEFSVSAWRDVDDDGFPQGERKAISTELRPHEVDGEIVAYDARFRLPRWRGHAYLSAFASWSEHGDSTWTYHVRLRS